MKLCSSSKTWSTWRKLGEATYIYFFHFWLAKRRIRWEALQEGIASGLALDQCRWSLLWDLRWDRVGHHFSRWRWEGSIDILELYLECRIDQWRHARKDCVWLHSGAVKNAFSNKTISLSFISSSTWMDTGQSCTSLWRRHYVEDIPSQHVSSHVNHSPSSIKDKIKGHL